MLILRNSKDKEIDFTNVGLAKRYYMFSKKDIEDFSCGLDNVSYNDYCAMVKNYNDDLNACESMWDIANTLNLYTDDFGNGSIFSVDEI